MKSTTKQRGGKIGWYVILGGFLIAALALGIALQSPWLRSKAARAADRILAAIPSNHSQSNASQSVAKDPPSATALPMKRASVASGPLKVHPSNPRYFADSSGRAVLLTGSHTWLNLQDGVLSDPPPAFDYSKYLDFLASHNHNFFRLWTWEQAKWVNESSEDYFFAPLPYERNGPGIALDGKPKFDLQKLNQAYYDRLRQRVVAAGNRNMYVSIMLFNGWSIQTKGQYQKQQPWNGHPFNVNNNINGINGDVNGNGEGEEIETLQNAAVTALQETYVRKVIDTVNDLDNVLFEISNEGPENSSAWQYHMIDFIKAYEATKPKQHPVGMTVAWPNGSNADLFVSPADWISLNGDITNPPVADGSKVIISDTDHLCGICGDRSWVWKSFTRGENPIFMDQYDDGYKLEGGGYDPNNANDVSLRRNLGYAQTYANRMNLAAMRPLPNLASSGYCLANPSSSEAEYLIYLPSGGQVTVDLSASNGKLDVEWLNPGSGAVTAGSQITGGGNRSFQAPFGGDAVLYIFSAPQNNFNLYLPSLDKQYQAPNTTPQPSAEVFQDTFDGQPSAPEPFESSRWDIAVHTRNASTFFAPEPMEAGHDPDCSPPPGMHMIDTYEDTVFLCRDHIMTALNDSGYGVIYLTPNVMVDFSKGEAVVKFNLSTLRTSTRDWIDLWITPFEQNLQLPLQTSFPDLQGPPKNAVLVEMQSGNVFVPTIFRDFVEQRAQFGDPGLDLFTGYEQFLTPSATRRDTFELRITRDHLRFGMPAYNHYWMDVPINPPLTWTQGVVQFGHHSYNPTKGCAEGGSCGPNTWHWDNIVIDPALPFTIIHSDRRYADNEQNQVHFDAPAPAGAYLRFSAIGNSIEVSFNGGSTWEQAKKQLQSIADEGHFASYWSPIPPGVSTVQFRGQDWWGGDWHARNFTVWSKAASTSQH